MSFRKSCFLALAWAGCLCVHPVLGEPLPQGESLLPPDLAMLELGGLKAQDARRELVRVDGQVFRDALRVRTLKKPPYPWDVRLVVKTSGAIRAGDVLMASFHARRIESRQETGEALVDMIVEDAGGDHEKVLELSASVGPEWTLVRAPFAVHRGFGPGGAQLSLRLGHEPQVIEIAAVRLENFGRKVALKDLPRTVARYAGWEPEAPWRKAAADRIEQLRKGDLEVEVVDAAGKPVVGAKVSVRMKRHEFAFGSAVTARMIAGEPGADGERYRETVERCFNKVVFENDLKWPAWIEGGPDAKRRREQVLAAIDWLRARRIAVRGHVMVWPSWRNLPGRMAELRGDPGGLRREVAAHIADQTKVLGGKLDEWDVINESYAHHDLMDVLGRGEMIEWFRMARQGDRNVRLFYNDYIMFAGSGPGSPSQYFHDTIRFLKEGGAPIGGIGEQGHFGGSPPSPLRVLAAFDHFAGFGLPIQISEFDIDTSDQELQVAYMRDFMTACFSHPSLTGVMSWGFWEGRHWKPRAAMWDKSWRLRPHGKVWLDLVTKEWWTNAEAVTGDGGKCSVRAFRGEHEVSAGDGAGRVTKPVVVPRGGTRLRVELR